MTKFKKFDKANLKTLRDLLQAALEDVGAVHDIKVTLGRCTYGDDNCKFNLEVAIIGEGGVVKDKFATAYEQIASYSGDGLKKEWLNQPFEYNGQTFILTGYNPKGRKLPLIAKGPKGNGYKVPIHAVRNHYLRIAQESTPHYHVADAFEGCQTIRTKTAYASVSEAMAAIAAVREAEKWLQFSVFTGCTCAAGKNLKAA